MGACRRAAKHLFPESYQYLSSLRFRLHCKRKYAVFQRRVKASLYGDRMPTVLSGPFKGLGYLDEEGLWGPITPKWIGSYEDELHPFLEQILARPPQLILDVGSAEGYYSVLLAARLPGTVVHSYDIDPFARRSQRRLARLNGVCNLRIGSHCDHHRMAQILGSCADGGMIICDIEGGERSLLDPGLCPPLAQAVILVEVHDMQGSDRTGTGKLLTKRFEASHHIEFVEHKVKDLKAYQQVLGDALPLDDLAQALNEAREASRGYLIMRPRDVSTVQSPVT